MAVKRYGGNAREFERPLHDMSRASRITARPSPPPSAAINPPSAMRAVGAHLHPGIGRLAQAEPLRLAALLQLLRDLGLTQFLLDLFVTRLGVVVVAGQVVVFAFDLRNLRQPRVVHALLAAEISLDAAS